MASETVKLIGAVELEYSATAAGSLRVLTDLTGNAMSDRVTPLVIPAGTRRQVRFRLPGVLKGHLLQLVYSPGSGTARIFQARVWARELPRGAWAWFPVYVPETSDEWQTVPLPIPATSQEWSPVQLPIPATSEEWSTAQLPMPQTPHEWSALSLPIKPTPLIPEWVAVEVDR